MFAVGLLHDERHLGDAMATLLGCLQHQARARRIQLCEIVDTGEPSDVDLRWQSRVGAVDDEWEWLRRRCLDAERQDVGKQDDGDWGFHSGFLWMIDRAIPGVIRLP